MTADSDSRLLKCRQCSKEFKYESERRRHEQSHIPQFKCKVCNKNFSFISALRRHEKQHERTGNVRCSKCSREFRDNILLQRHIKYAHGGTYTCSKCNATFSSESALNTHMKTHKSESERRYQCSFYGCTKKFNFAHHLKHHELTHTNTKQHYCKICNKGFIQSHHLKTHLKTHDADYSLYCTYPNCNRKFATEYAKKRHYSKHHSKADSGISSDSNSTCDLSCLDKKLNNDSITCSSCNQVVLKSHYEKHTLNCIRNIKEELNNDDVPKKNRIGDNTAKTTNRNVDDDEIHTCKSVLGSCIMSNKDEKCVCAQISKTTDETDEIYDFIPIENGPINMSKVNDIRNPCEGCECSGHCDIKNIEDVIPEIEYRTDGTVKIKDSFDMDICFDNSDKIEASQPKNEGKIVPYNSCKAILGNCIVSGNGTMGDGCLCARMFVDDQVTAQEIDDITPHPNEEFFGD